MKSPVLFTLLEIKELYEAFKEFVRTKGFYEECLERLKKYETSIFKLVIKNNKTSKMFRIRKNDFIGKSSAGLQNDFFNQKREDIHFYRAWVRNNKHIKLSSTQIRHKNRYINLVGDTDQSIKNTRIFLSLDALIVSKTDDKTSLKDAVTTKEQPAEELVYLAQAYDEFVSNFKGAKTQENFNSYFKNQYLPKVISPYHRQSMAEPIIKIMELTRELLCDTLLKHFRTKIIEKQTKLGDTNSPEDFLKNNKNKIFEIAQEVNLVDDAQQLIKFHDLRNNLAHPDTNMDVYVDVPEYVDEIQDTIFNFIKHITSKKNLTIEKVPDTLNLSEIDVVEALLNGQKIPDCIPIVEKDKDIETPALIHTMQCLDVAFKTAAPLGANGKPIKGKKQRDWLKNQGMMADSDLPDYEMAKNLRNAICHGVATQQTYADIVASNSSSQKLTQKIIQNMRQQGLIN